MNIVECDLEDQARLESLQSAPDFWNDQDEANRVLRKIQSLKQWTVPVEEASEQAEELTLLAEMAAEESDDDTWGEVATGLDALEKAIEKLKGQNDDQDVGISILRRAVEEPLRQIVNNAGGDPSVVLNAVAEGTGNYGYNTATGEFGDMIEAGILDPTKVTRFALQNAASVSGLLLTTEAMVAEAPRDEAAAPAMPDMGGMGGMGGMM